MPVSGHCFNFNLRRIRSILTCVFLFLFDEIVVFVALL